MRIDQAAWVVANEMSDLRAHVKALAAGIESMAKDPNFQKHPLRNIVVHEIQVIDGIVNKEVK